MRGLVPRAGTGALIGVLSVAALAGDIPPTDRRSGFDFMGAESQAMQRDDTANPGMLWVHDGEALWNRRTGLRGRACADCHGDARITMRGVAARYPAFDRRLDRALALEDRINQCRTEHQGAPALAWESQELLAATAYVAHQSRGLAIAGSADERMAPVIEAGRRLFAARQGQLNLSCAGCHDDHWGQRLAGNPVPQGHPTGYPLYRLEWQGLGSLQRRLRNCMVGMRAEPFAFGSPDHVALEAYLMSRASGLVVETPAVRP